ncbi:MAG: hypothetical protein P4L35_17285 [Ignavibacteriaceae bacterium]|nr:hypothetical protein [Ignavibacteriaceae bacterium]
MNFVISKEDFTNLKKIESINKDKKLFSKQKGYSDLNIKKEVKRLQKPIWDKMKELKISLSSESYFTDRFDIIVSRPNRQSTGTVKGPTRRLVWVSLASLSELSKKGDKKLNHTQIPQLQISFQPDKLIVASIWLEGNYCKQVYREKLLTFLKSNGLNKRYKLQIFNKDNDKKVFENNFNNLSLPDYERYLAGRNYSIGITLIYKAEELSGVEKKLYSLITSELQYLNENIFIPCFHFRTLASSKSQKVKSKNNRKERGKFDIKDFIRKAIDPTVVTKKHKAIQNTLYALFGESIKGTKNIVRMEKDYVDIMIERPGDKTLILYEIKTDKTALNCIKHGIGQLLFYELVNKNSEWEKIELVIVGLPKLTTNEKEFVKSIKEYLGNTVFRYQRFDEEKEVLLDERKS